MHLAHTYEHKYGGLILEKSSHPGCVSAKFKSVVVVVSGILAVLKKKSADFSSSLC